MSQEESDTRKPTELCYDHPDFRNYVSLETDPMAPKLMEDLAKSEFTQSLYTYEEVVSYLKGEPVLSKVALIIVKETSIGKKYRLILDCRVSGSNDAAKKVERALLSKCWDVVRDAMALKKQCAGDEGISLFVLDFRDAFYI